MKPIILFSLLVIFSISLTSCGTAVTSIKSQSNEAVAGYTLKSKKELFSQRIIYKKNKTVLVQP